MMDLLQTYFKYSINFEMKKKLKLRICGEDGAR